MPTFSLNEWINLLGTWYDRYGYFLVLFGTLGENTAVFGFFLPGNLLVLLGAMYARLGTLNLGWVILLATLGTTLGYQLDYFFGRFVLTHVAVRWSKSRLGRRIRLAGRLRLARMLLSKHGGKAILFSHLVGFLRSFIALSAGMTHMNYRRFLGYELVAATLWNSAFCLLGYLLAAEIDQLHVVLERSGWLIAGILLLLFLIWRLLKPRLRRARLKARHRREIRTEQE